MSDLSPKQLVREAAKNLRQEENAVAREVKVREKEQVRADKLLAFPNEQSKKEKADTKLEAMDITTTLPPTMTSFVARTEVDPDVARSELRDLIFKRVPADVLETVVDVMTTGPYLMLYNYYDGITVNGKYLIRDDTTLLLNDWVSRHLPSLPLTKLKWFSRFSDYEFMTREYEFMTGSETLTVLGLSTLTGIMSYNFPALQSLHLQLFKESDEVFDGVTELKIDCIEDLEDSDSLEGLFRMFPNLIHIISPVNMFDDDLMPLVHSIQMRGINFDMEDISDFHGFGDPDGIWHRWDDEDNEHL